MEITSLEKAKKIKLEVDYCIKNNIGILVIGYNKGWKQNSNMGKSNNQNFVSVPFLKLVKQIQYKSELIGNEVNLVEESYTSKCSFLDNEPIRKHKNTTIMDLCLYPFY